MDRVNNMHASMKKAVFIAGLFTTGVLVSAGQVQQAAPAAKATALGTPTHYQISRMPRRAEAYYQSVWGVDSLRVKIAESGELVRFSYRVLDPERSKSLNDKKLEPGLILPRVHLKLVIPQLENVGMLRQTSTPEAGKVYWMAFSNHGEPVKRGDHVDIVIGKFRAEGLLVE